MKPLYGLGWLIPLENLCMLFPSSVCVFIFSLLAAATKLSACVNEIVVSLNKSALKALIVASSSGRLLFSANLMETKGPYVCITYSSVSLL